MLFTILPLIYAGTITLVTSILIFVIKRRSVNQVRVRQEASLSPKGKIGSVKVSPKKTEEGYFSKDNIKRRKDKRESSYKENREGDQPKTIVRKTDFGTNLYINQKIKESKLRKAKSMLQEQIEINQQRLLEMRQQQFAGSQTQLNELATERENQSALVPKPSEDPKLSDAEYLIFLLTRTVCELSATLWLFRLGLEFQTVIPVSLAGGVLVRVVEKWGLNWFSITVISAVNLAVYFSVVYLAPEQEQIYTFLGILGAEMVLSLAVYLALRNLD